MPTDVLRVFVLNVGQGNSVVAIAPDGGAIVVDCYDGPKTEHLLRGLHVKCIDLLATTHPHHDHLRGVPLLVREFPVHTWWDARAPCAMGSYLETLRLCREKRVRATGIRGLNVELQFGDVVVRVIAPSPEVRHRLDEEVLANQNRLPSNRSFNDYSFVLSLHYGRFAMILGADAEMSSWAGTNVTLPDELRCQVLVIPHHGSCRGSHLQLIETMGPRHIVVSYGMGNRYGHPDPLTRAALKRYCERINRGAKVWETPSDGTISIEATKMARAWVRGLGERPDEMVALEHC